MNWFAIVIDAAIKGDIATADKALAELKRLGITVQATRLAVSLWREPANILDSYPQKDKNKNQDSGSAKRRGRMWRTTAPAKTAANGKN